MSNNSRALQNPTGALYFTGNIKTKVSPFIADTKTPPGNVAFLGGVSLLFVQGGHLFLGRRVGQKVIVSGVGAAHKAVWSHFNQVVSNRLNEFVVVAGEEDRAWEAFHGVV